MPGFLLDAAVFPTFDDTRVRDAITGMAPETRAAVLNGSLPYVPDTNFPREPEEEDGDEEEEVAALLGSEPSAGSNSQESGAGRSQHSNSLLVVVRGTAAFSGALGDYHSDNPSVSTNHRHLQNGRCRSAYSCWSPSGSTSSRIVVRGASYVKSSLVSCGSMTNSNEC
jgi:hypothetical protein